MQITNDRREGIPSVPAILTAKSRLVISDSFQKRDQLYAVKRLLSVTFCSVFDSYALCAPDNVVDSFPKKPNSI